MDWIESAEAIGEVMTELLASVGLGQLGGG